MGLTSLVAPGIQTLTGIGQMIFSGRRKAERELNALDSQVPQYEGSQPLSAYYQNALQRFNTSPTQSAMYKRNMQNVERGAMSGLRALQGRGGALAGVNKLMANKNNALLNTEASAEQEQNRRFGELGRAANFRALEDLRKFQYNKLAPFQRKDRLAQMKLSAANARFDAGTQNLFGGTSSGSLLLNKEK